MQELRKGLNPSEKGKMPPSPKALGAADKEEVQRRRRTKQLGEVFVAFDLDADGKVDAKELDTLARVKREIAGKGSWTDDKNLSLFTRVDRDASGGVDKKAASNRQAFLPKQSLAGKVPGRSP